MGKEPDFIDSDNWPPFEKLIRLDTFGASPNAGGTWLQGTARVPDTESWMIMGWRVIFHGFERDPPDRFALARLGVAYGSVYWERPLFYFVDDMLRATDPIVRELIQRVTCLESIVAGREGNRMLLREAELAHGQVQLPREPPPGATAEMLIFGKRKKLVR